MAKIHADGAEEMRHRTPEEIAAIEEVNRVAARSNMRSGQDRRYFCLPGSPVLTIWRGPNDAEVHYGPNRRRHSDRRTTLSTFERDMLLGATND